MSSIYTTDKNTHLKLLKPKIWGEDLTGQIFERLTVISFAERRGGLQNNKRKFWLCLCKCGTQKVIAGEKLKSGNTISCGCRKSALGKDALGFKHGLVEHPLYWVLSGIKQRCSNLNDLRYGGRGISICEEWINIENFYKWSIENGWKPGLTIERRDVNGNYCPENCEWIPMSEQGWNTRQTVWVEYLGRKLSLPEACKISGTSVKYATIYYRLKVNNMSFEEAISVYG